MAHRYFDRSGKAITQAEWSDLFGTLHYKIVERTELANGVVISTVWLGLDHRFSDDDCADPVIFETLVFPSWENMSEEDGERYCTEAEARYGHWKFVQGWWVPKIGVWAPVEAVA